MCTNRHGDMEAEENYISCLNKTKNTHYCQ